ncbi:MAG: hypothetical protein HZA61_04035 [Candidatus Eisenbacteria bacterium]|uniref:Outer membrane lipoprotein-sorting protein n=1 Tax=Eiseniibacteriota bacterium TaxID=2212470 RepID=A0A933SER0_UNCEI|nr:hypothetical protein [Candidatus Eisenbacteria bacterium]
MTLRTTPLFPAFLLAVLASGAASPPAAAEVKHGPTLAVEDTMRTDISEVLVHAPRVTLDEILDRVHRGEMRRDSALRDQSYQLTVRVVRDTDGRKKPVLVQETVDRVYMRRPNQSRTVRLRDWRLKPKKDENGEDKGVSVSADADMSEEIVNFAFRPANRGEFKFRIVGRELLGDHLIYKIRFEPRSALDQFNPSGLVWVDTHEYVIVRQQLELKQSPVPLFLKGVRGVVIERQRQGDFWMLSRILARMDMTIPMPGYGRSFDIGLQFSDYRINAGLPDSLFAPAPKGARK